MTAIVGLRAHTALPVICGLFISVATFSNCSLAEPLAVPAAVESRSSDATDPSFSREHNQVTIQPLTVLDGQVYTRDDLLSAFIEIAFSSYIRPNLFPYATPLPPHSACGAVHPKRSPNHDLPLDRVSTTAGGALLPDPEICSTSAEVKQRYPWLYEYLYRTQGFPRYFAINKWQGPIRVSVGYPNDLKPLGTAPEPESSGGTGFLISDFSVEAARHAPNSPQFSPPEKQQAARETTRIAIAEVQAATPTLSALIGLPVTYVPHEQETIDEPANLRIIVADNLTKWNTTLKRNSVLPSGQIRDAISLHSTTPRSPYHVAAEFVELEQALLTKVIFTPYSDRQVDGFILPKADNSIGMAFCFIGNENSAEAVKALVRECLVRSLGLPNAVRARPSMVLGLWNDPTSNLAQVKQWHTTTPSLTDFDRYMIQLLYTRAIKAGMSVTDVYDAISK